MAPEEKNPHYPYETYVFVLFLLFFIVVIRGNHCQNEPIILERMKLLYDIRRDSLNEVKERSFDIYIVKNQRHVQ